HSEITHNELRKEREIESDKNDKCGEAGPTFRIQPARDFRPPEVDPSEIGHHRAPDHDVVEMCDDEVRIRHMDIDGERSKKESGESTHREETDETKCIQHRSVVGD